MVRAKQYRFTMVDYAQYAGMDIRKVRRDVAQGVFVPSEIGSVSRYLVANSLLEQPSSSKSQNKKNKS